jgi:hypothetical protein
MVFFNKSCYGIHMTSKDTKLELKQYLVKDISMWFIPINHEKEPKWEKNFIGT